MKLSSRSCVVPLLFSVATGACSSSCGAARGPSTASPDATALSSTGSPSSSTAPPPSASVAASATRASPLDRLASRHRSFPRPACPLALEPSVGLGPVDIGDTRDDLQRTGLPVKELSSYRDTAVLEVGALKVSTCGGKVIDVWLDDLRQAPDCVVFQGKPLPRTIPLEQLTALLPSCPESLPRHGGTFERCADGGLYLGHGMGDFLQLRVRAPGEAFDLDEDCQVAMDDGTPVTLPESARLRVLQKALDAEGLSPHWHVTQPGRDPLRIVKNEWFPEMPAFKMFGSPVVWIDRAEARAGTAYLEVTALRATKTRVDIEFRYPIEGVSGHLALRPTDDDYRVLTSELTDRSRSGGPVIREGDVTFVPAPGEDGRPEWLCSGSDGAIRAHVFSFDNGPDPLAEGLRRYVTGGKMGFVDAHCRIAIPAAWTFVEPFHDGRAKGCVGCSWQRDGEYWTTVGGRSVTLDKAGREK